MFGGFNCPGTWMAQEHLLVQTRAAIEQVASSRKDAIDVRRNSEAYVVLYVYCCGPLVLYKNLPCPLPCSIFHMLLRHRGLNFTLDRCSVSVLESLAAAQTAVDDAQIRIWRYL